MFFLKFELNDVVDIINNALRGLFGFLCEIIYPGIASLYDLFKELGSLFYVDKFTTIYNKISLIIGIFMVFRVTFWLIESLINPDTLSDKEKNPGKLIQKVLVSVVLLAITPTIFEKAFDIQNKIIKSNIIENVMSIGTDNTGTTAGRYLAAELFINFYTPTIAENNGEDVPVASNCTDTYTGRDGKFYSDLYYNGKMKNLNNYCLTQRINDDPKKGFEIDFNGLFATAVGGFVFWMILMYCISLGARYIQLIYLQVIAPIPIMCYLAPGKDNMFSKWLKQCTTTYLDLFIRLAIINFVMLLCNMLLSNTNGIFYDINTGTTSSWITIFLILGLLTFAKKAPDLIQELLPKSVTKASGDFGLSWKKRTDAMVGGKFIDSGIKKGIGFTASTLATAPLRLGVRAYNASKFNQKEDKKLDRYRQQRINQIMGNGDMTDAQKEAERNRLTSMSNSALRKDLRKDTKDKLAEYNSLLGDNSKEAVKRRAELMEQITTNRASGMEHRNQAVTAATSILGATATSANAAIKGKTVSQIFKGAMESQGKAIKAEQGWYKDGGSSDFGEIVKRTISEVQRTFGIETEGQAIQYVIDEYEAEIKAKEEKVAKAKEIEQGYSSGKSSVKAVESEGSGDFEKNKPITMYDPSTGEWKNATILSTRTGTMDAALARTTEYYNAMSSTESIRPIARGSAQYNVLSNLIETISRNCSADPSEQTKVRRNLMERLESSANYEDAYNAILTLSNQQISKSKSDYGKEQAAAAVMSHLFKQAGQTAIDQNGQAVKLYSNQAIENQFASIMRELNTNSGRYSDEIIEIRDRISTFLTVDQNGRARNVTMETFDESTLKELASLWGDLKDRYEVEQARAALEVSSLSDELQETRHEASSFKGFVVTQDKLNADKYNGSK